MKKIFLGIFFITALFTFSFNSFAADSSGCVAPEYLGGASYCPGQDYYAGHCGPRVTCTAPATFNCSSGTCVCPACGTYPTCTSAPTLDCSTTQHRVLGGTTCAPSCGVCLTGYIDLTPADTSDPCIGACTEGSLRTSAGCVPMEPVASLLAPIFGKTLANLVTITTTEINTILANMTANPAYYFLKPNNGPTISPAPTTVINYKYGTGGEGLGNDKIRLEADWADESYLADYLNWNNIPANIANLFQNLAGVTFCTVNADCTPGTCVSGICTGSVLAGGACNNTNLFCVSPLVCTDNTCQTASNQISPSDITPGNAYQVLTSLDSGVAGWADPVVGGLGQFVGITSTSYSYATAVDYAAVNNYCKTGTITVPTNGTTGTTTQTGFGAHVCDASEMTNSYNNANAAIGWMATNTVMADTALINNGPPGYLSFSNDCLGWDEGGDTVRDGYFDGKKVYGAVWNFADKSGRLSWCADIVTAGLKFACCK